IDLWRAFTRERAGLATALERAAGLGSGKVFDSHGFSFLLLEAARAAFAAEATAVTTWTAAFAVITVALLHHRRRAFFQLVHAHCHEAQNVFIDAHLAFHFSNGSRGGVDVEKGIVSLAVLADAVGETLEAPIFVLGNLAPALAEDL